MMKKKIIGFVHFIFFAPIYIIVEWRFNHAKMLTIVF